VNQNALANAVLYPELARRIACPGRRGQILAGMWEGKGTKEIAAELGISPKTVEYHRYVLYGLLKVDNPVSLVRRAIEEGLINPKVEVRGPKEMRNPNSEEGGR